MWEKEFAFEFHTPTPTQPPSFHLKSPQNLLSHDAQGYQTSNGEESSYLAS